MLIYIYKINKSIINIRKKYFFFKYNFLPLTNMFVPTAKVSSFKKKILNLTGPHFETHILYLKN